MEAVFDNFDLYLRAFGYTFALFLVAGILSMILGTFLAAMRVGPVAVLRAAAGTYVTVVRNTPLVIVFAFFSFAAPIYDIKFNWLDVHIGQFDFTSFFGAAVVSLTLYTSTFVCEGLRSGINAVPLGPGRGRPRDRAAVRRGDAPRGAAAGVPGVACLHWPACRSR